MVLVTPNVREYPLPPLGNFENWKLMQFGDTFGRKLGYLWSVGWKLGLRTFLLNFSSLTWSLNTIDLLWLLAMIVKQLSLPLLWLIKSNILHAPVSADMLNTDVLSTLVCTGNMVSRLTYLPSWLKLKVHACMYTTNRYYFYLVTQIV